MELPWWPKIAKECTKTTKEKILGGEAAKQNPPRIESHGNSITLGVSHQESFP